MSRNCFSGNLSSCSLGDHLRRPRSSCRPSYPSNVVYSTDLCAPKPTQWGSPLSRGCQQTCPEPSSCRTSCSSLRTSMFCSPCRPTYPGSLGCGSRRCYFVVCGPNGFRPLRRGGCGFPPLSSQSSFCPAYFPSGRFYSSCYWPLYRYGFY